jgi:hypothetical protein
MATVNRADTAVNLELAGAWNGGAGPAPTSSDVATWGSPNITTNVSRNLGASVSWQGISFLATQTSAISIGLNSLTLTLGASGIDLSASGANFSISNPTAITLGANQTWNVGSGRTLTVSAAISGAFSLTKSDAGTLALAGNTSNFGGSGKSFTVSAGLVTTSVVNAMGSSLNSVVVSSGGALRMTASPAQTAFTVSGQGNALQAGAIFFNVAGGIASGKTVTLTGASPTIGVLANTQAVVISGSPTGSVTFNMSGTNNTTATFTNASSFLVASGNYVVLQGVNPLTGTATAADFSFSTTDLNGLGDAANAVNVKSSLRLLNGDNSAVTLSRNYLFDGELTNATPTTYAIAPKAAIGSGLTFQGTVSIGTAGYWIKTSTSGGSTANFIQFGSATGGKIDGQVNLRVFSTITTLRLHPNLDISTWIPSGGVGGEIYVNDVSYGVAPTGAATWNPNNTVDNIKGSALTLAHSSLSIFAGTVTFTGTDDLSLGVGPITTTGGVTFATSTAGKRLSIPNSIAGSGTLGKSSAGTLTLSGNNTGFTAFSHTGGVLELNSDGSAGPAGATFSLSAATANTLDSTTGATLAQTGAILTSANFTWGGSADLTFGSGLWTWGNPLTISFLNGKTGILKIPGNAGTPTATRTLSFGGTPVNGSRSRFWLGGTNACLSTGAAGQLLQVTAGYFRVSNSAGLGNAVTTMWTVSSGAALEVDGGISPPSARSVTITGPGPNTDGALRSVSGTNTWSGAIIPPVQSLASPTRIQVDAGTFTLDAGSSYPNIAPTVSGTPLQFTALGASAVLNQPRQLTSFVSDVTVNNGGVGTVVFSVANAHTGTMTCEGGTTRVTQASATGSGAGNDVVVAATATLESTVQSQFTTLRLGTNGSGSRAILKFAA